MKSPSCTALRIWSATAVATLALAATPSAAFAVSGGLAPRMIQTDSTLTVESGDTFELTQTLQLTQLVIEDGGTITVPEGKSVTLTVDGVETGQKLVTTEGVATALQPGTYAGDVVLTLTDANDWSDLGITWPLRQALLINQDGVDARSVLEAVQGGTVTASEANSIAISSTGENFNGVIVDDANYALFDPTFAFDGNGRYDFSGVGASVLATGDSANLLVDGATISNEGSVRTGIVATNGANLVVKNSTIRTADGVLPSDYVPRLAQGQMRSAPWMLGVVGNVRATNLVGANTKATYINSDVSSTGWGALSTDSTQDGVLTAIDTNISVVDEGYGSYADGQTVLTQFYGSTFDVVDYGLISTGGHVIFDDSDAATVAGLNESLQLELTPAELNSLADQPTTIDSDRFGVMWHGGGRLGASGGLVEIGGGTTLTTGETAFIAKSVYVTLNIDGSEGATVAPGNGVLFQLMQSDDPGPVMTENGPVNTGVYVEPTAPAAHVADFDVTVAHDNDSVMNLSAIDLTGDVFNSTRDAQNLVVNLDGASLQGVISSSSAHHAVDTIDAANYQQLGEVTNTVEPAINNGVLVNLEGTSSWTVTGTSHLSSLTIGDHAQIKGDKGQDVRLTVDGEEQPVTPGASYTGDLVLMLVDHETATPTPVPSQTAAPTETPASTTTQAGGTLATTGADVPAGLFGGLIALLTGSALVLRRRRSA